jgi:hypothetical protein
MRGCGSDTIAPYAWAQPRAPPRLQEGGNKTSVTYTELQPHVVALVGFLAHYAQKTAPAGSAGYSGPYLAGPNNDQYPSLPENGQPSSWHCFSDPIHFEGPGKLSRKRMGNFGYQLIVFTTVGALLCPPITIVFNTISMFLFRQPSGNSSDNFASRSGEAIHSPAA